MNKFKKIVVFLCWFLNSQRTSKYVVNILFCFGLLVVFEITDNSILDDVISFFLGFFISNLVVGLIQMIFRSVEDNAKVTDDTEKLVKLYKDDAVEKKVEINNTFANVAYKPLYFNDGSPLVVEDDATKNFKPDDFISDNYQLLLSAHRMSKKENFTTVRLDDFKIQQGQAKFSLSRSNYYYHLVTNRAIDYHIDDDLSLRAYYDFGPAMCSLTDSNMSNHIGINALVYLKDGELLLPRRSGNSTISKNLITSSIAIMLLLPPDNKISAEYLFKDCILEGLVSRTKMKPEWIQESQIDIEFLGFGQNPYEGGKPQFYYSVKMKDVGRKEYIKELCRQKEEEKKKAAEQSAEDNIIDYSKCDNSCLTDKPECTITSTVYVKNASEDTKKDASKLLNKRAIDADKYIYIVDTSDMRFNKNEYLVIPHYHGCLKNGKYVEKKRKATVGYEKSFLANVWHKNVAENHSNDCQKMNG